MLDRLGCAAACGWLVVALGGCRSASEGSPAREVASVARDVATRTGVAPAEPTCDEVAGAAWHGLLRAGPLTEDRAVKIALLHNASVRESYERLGIARAELLQAGLVSNPVFTASVKSFGKGPELELGLLGSFVELFFVPLRRRVASAELCATQAQVARELVHLVYEVRRALVVVRGAEEVARVRREALAAVTTARDLMAKLHAAGNVRDADLTIEEVGAARARLEADAADATARDARETVNVLLGLGAGDAGWTLEGANPSLPAPRANDVEARALASSLELLEEDARIAAALESAGLACRRGALPGLDLGVGAKREAGDGAWGVGPAVTAALPIFDQGRAKVLASNATARSHAARREHATIEVSSAARRFAARAAALRERERYLREVYLPLRVRYVVDTVQTYNGMQIGAFDVLDAKEGETDARREHAETLAAAWLAELDLAELLAGSLDRARLAPPPTPERTERPSPPKGH